MEIECGTCGEEFIIEYHGEEPITFCPFCGTDIENEIELEIEEDDE